MRRLAPWSIFSFAVVFSLAASPLWAADDAKPAENPPPEKKSTGLPEAGDLQAIAIGFGRESADGVKLSGRDADSNWWSPGNTPADRFEI